MSTLAAECEHGMGDSEPANHYVADFSRHGDISEYLAGIIGERFGEYRRQWDKAFRLETVTDFPLYLSLETKLDCNYRCAMCVYSNPEALADQHYSETMSDALFGRIIGEVREHGCPSMGFNMMNEPLMDPKIIDRIAEGNRAGVIDSRINTNGSLLTRERAEKLVDSGLTRLLVSLDAASKETYEKIRIGGNYEKVVRNIERFLDIRERKNQKLPILRVSMVRLDYNEHENQAFMDYWKDRADLVSMQEYRPQVDEDKYLERSVDNEAKKITNPDFTCTNPFERMAVKGNGDVLPCCSQVGYRIKLGNMKDGTVFGYWHSERMKEIRRHMKDRTWREIPTCNDCLKDLVRS